MLLIVSFYPGFPHISCPSDSTLLSDESVYIRHFLASVPQSNSIIHSSYVQLTFTHTRTHTHMCARMVGLMRT